MAILTVICSSAFKTNECNNSMPSNCNLRAMDVRRIMSAGQTNNNADYLAATNITITDLLNKLRG